MGPTVERLMFSIKRQCVPYLSTQSAAVALLNTINTRVCWFDYVFLIGLHVGKQKSIISTISNEENLIDMSFLFASRWWLVHWWLFLLPLQPIRIIPAIQIIHSLTIFCEFWIEENLWKNYSSFFWIRVPYSGQDFGHTETRKQESVNGEYHVLLPDDRLQVVRYTADQNGYVADVQYTDGSTSPAYGKSSGYSSNGDYSNDEHSRRYSNGGGTLKTSSYFNPSSYSSSSSYSSPSGYYVGSQASGSRTGYNQHSSNSGAYLQGNQGFKSGCVCQCPE